MRKALGAKNKLSIIDGSMEIPYFDDLNQRCNHLVHSWLINYVSDSITQTIIFHENSIDVWMILKKYLLK